MNTETGEIRHLKEAELGLLRIRSQVSGARIWVELTPEQAAFFETKGIAFRQLWGKKLARGLTPEEKERLEAVMSELEKEPSE